MTGTRIGVPRRRRGVSARLWVRVAVSAPLLTPAPVLSQYDEVPPPAAYALVGVTAVRPQEGTLEDATLIVRDGMIAYLGVEEAVPADALVLEGENLRVYPGLVDAWGSADVELPPPPRGDDVTPWDASRDAQGFTPHRRVVDHLTVDGSDLHDQRVQGVVASGIFPAQGFAGGLGAVLLHRPDAVVPRELVADPEVGLALSFSPSSTSYPSTLFGVIAYLRQAFTDAQRLALVESQFRVNPNGLTFPEWDPDAEVLRRVAGAGLPAFFQADGREDIRRVLSLAFELGFSPIVVGGDEAWRMAEELAGLDVPVLVSLDFPEPTLWDPDAEEAAPEAEPPGLEPVPVQELDPGVARERQRLLDVYSNPGRLDEAGVEFALTSGGGFADLRAGARRAMEHGLSEEAALRALTQTPASLLGVGTVTRIVPGYAATFIVTDGPLFEEETRIVYTFVEGVLDRADDSTDEVDEEGEEGDGSAPGNGDAG